MSSLSLTSSTWQQKLEEKCCELQINPPVYETYSDRRGGRTAWSSRVIVSGQSVAARCWYDGQYLHNAREDAAEMALKMLSQVQTAQAAVQPLPQDEDVPQKANPRPHSSMAGFKF